VSLPPDAADQLNQWLGPRWSARPLAGDASVRAYYRVAADDGTSYIATYYPEEVRSQLSRVLGAFEAVSPHGPVPRILHHGDVITLQQDVGDRSIFDVLHEDREEGLALYRQAVELLVRFQNAQCAINAPFTGQFFLAELAMAVEFYVEKLMDAPAGELRPLLQTISENIARHPYVLCHRDFHGQNVHVNNGELFVLDYQDLRMGPDTYDMASLLRDRGQARILGDEGELALLEHYRELRGADTGIRRRYFETLLQRSIKILGTFAKQPIVRGRMHYLEFIPATLESIERCIAELPEYAALGDAFPLRFDLDAARTRARQLNTE
jgi:aminoglycoside/choline kinase family phosphotransferase